MKQFGRIILFAAMLCALGTQAGYADSPTEGMKFVDALELRMINNGFPREKMADPYMRIPIEYKDSMATGYWSNIICSSGLGIRFASDSRRIGVRYVLKKNHNMNHMAPTGTKGMDLYVLGGKGKWEYVNTIKPVNSRNQDGLFVQRLDGKKHEYLIYLPLYDGIDKMEVAVDQDAEISAPKADNPSESKGKIVLYGTSITQGGCASRTGMVSSNIIQRDLGVECVNFGISAYGYMDMTDARILASMEDVSAYVLDPVPNCSVGICDTVTCNFVRFLRESRPGVPVIMIEGLMYPYAKHDSYYAEFLSEKNVLFRKNYEILKKENPRGLYYVPCEGITGRDEEGTVDGVHYTDFGFRAYADIIEKVLRKALKSRL